MKFEELRSNTQETYWLYVEWVCDEGDEEVRQNLSFGDDGLFVGV